MIFGIHHSGRRTAGIGAAALVAALALTACGAASSGSPASTSAASSGAAGAGQGVRPGAAGQVAAITGSTMQVQSQQAGQVAVTWTSSTTFSQPVTTTVTAIKAGDCVIATGPSTSAGSSSSPGSSPSPGSSNTSFTATSLSVSTPVNGQCGGGGPGGAGGGQRPTGQRPSGAPTGGLGQRGTGAFATGTVSSVLGSTLVIAARQFGGSPGSTSTRTVTVDAQTKITTQQATTSQSVKVGKCVTAQGTADSTGTVTATSVRISDPVNGQCSLGGFGGGNTGG